MERYLLAWETVCASCLGDHPREALGTGENLCGEELALGFQQPRLARRDALGRRFTDEFIQPSGEVSVALQSRGGRSRERQGVLRLIGLELRERPHGIPQQSAPLAFALQRAVCRKQCETVGHGEAAADDGLREGVLLCFAQGGQGVGEAHGQPPLVDMPLKRLGETPCQGISFACPGSFPAQQARRGGQGQPVVFDEGLDDTRLVHGREGPRRGVGAQKQRLCLRSLDRIHDDRDLLCARVLRGAQALESVDDLEALRILWAADNPDRHRGETIVRRRLPGSKAGERGAEFLDRHHENRRRRSRCHRSSGVVSDGSSDRTW